MEGLSEADLPLNPALDAIEAGRIDEALSLLQVAAKEQPNNPETYYLAGVCLLRLGDHQAALDAFQRAIQIKVDWPDPYLGASQAQLGVGDAHGAMQTLLHVLNHEPGHLEATRYLSELLVRLKPDSYLPSLEPALQKCFAHANIDLDPLAYLCGQQLRLSIVDWFNPDDSTIPEAAIERLADATLWHLYLSRVINTDPYLEDFFTHLRKYLCLSTSLESDNTPPTALIAALAQQCFLNEYVFGLSNEESTQLEAFEEIIQDRHAPADSIALAFSLGCLYRAPNLDSITRALADSLSSDCPWIAGLCQLTVFEPFEEAQLAGALPTLHPIHNESSLAVQAQYELNPYPRWQTPPTPPKSALMSEFRRQFSLRTDAQPETGVARILVAGCGTGYEPIDIARRDNSVAITAIDLSRKSLAYAQRKAKAVECENIEFHHGDLLDLSRTQWEFDVIVCTGVLHHMEDPMAGWKTLRSKLAANGMMRISLYSAHARRAIQIAREHIQSRKLQGTVEDIRLMRQWILNDARDPELEPLKTSDDFYNMSGCRDLLFHVQEQQFTLPEIQSALDELNLRFCGFDFGDASILNAFSAQNPAPGATLDLTVWDLFEQANPRTFSGMYQFWCEYE